MNERTQLGTTGPAVFPIALGCMGMSPGVYGAAPEEKDGIATIQIAIERGVTLIDTGDFYSMGHNEMLVRKAIEGRRDKVQLSVKFGAMRDPAGAFLGVDARPAAIHNFVAYSLKRLGTDHIDIYRPARVDPNVPIEETIGAVADLVKKGYVRHIALSEVGADTIRRAAKVHPIVDLQIEYALVSRAPEEKIFPVLKELGISATLYGVLSRGLLSGSKPTGAGDMRGHLPRFASDHQDRNGAVVEAVRKFAADRRQTPAQLCVAWALAKEPGFVPTIGARTRAQIEGVLAALDKPLSAAEVAALEKLVPQDAVAGTRYPAAMMAHLDSER